MATAKFKLTDLPLAVLERDLAAIEAAFGPDSVTAQAYRRAIDAKRHGQAADSRVTGGGRRHE